MLLLPATVFMFCIAVEGRAEGNEVGDADGTIVIDGDWDGLNEGAALVVGCALREGLLDNDGTCEGLVDGVEVDGDDEGCIVEGEALEVGAEDGDGLGAGESVGSKLGSGVGALVGNCVGDCVGVAVGTIVTGTSVGTLTNFVGRGEIVGAATVGMGTLVLRGYRVPPSAA